MKNCTLFTRKSIFGTSQSQNPNLIPSPLMSFFFIIKYDIQPIMDDMDVHCSVFVNPSKNWGKCFHYINKLRKYHTVNEDIFLLNEKLAKSQHNAILRRSTYTVLQPQSIELTRALSCIGGVHIGRRALHILNIIGFGYIVRLSQWGGG